MTEPRTPLLHLRLLRNNYSSGLRSFCGLVLAIAVAGCGDVMRSGPSSADADGGFGQFDSNSDGSGDTNNDAKVDAVPDTELDVAPADTADTGDASALQVQFVEPQDNQFVQLGSAVTVTLLVTQDGVATAAAVQVVVKGASAVLLSGNASENGSFSGTIGSLPAGQLTLVATATNQAGTVGQAEQAIYVNTSPGAPLVAIAPNHATTLDKLEAVIVMAGADPDRAASALTYSYAWLRDSILTAENTAFIAPGVAKRGETWSVSVTAMDPYGNGGIGEASLVIEDAAPSTPTVALSNLVPDLTSEITCTVAVAAVDADGDVVTYQYQWFVDGALDASATTAQVVVAELAVAGVPSKIGSLIQCKAIATGGTKTSASALSAGSVVGEFNVCASPLNPCSPVATCIGGDTLAVECVCQTGYEGDGIVCTDVDECVENTDGCALAADCSNTVGNYICTCKPGYIGSGELCSDVDECALGSAGCSLAADCSNTVGSAVCTCKAGYQGDGATCTDIDECLVDNGGCGAVPFFACTNVVGAAPTCTDIDECLVNNGGCGSAALWTCSNVSGAAPTCTDINECLVNNGGCGSAVFWTCSNASGAAPTCTDINECLVNNGGCGSAVFWTCSNASGAAPTCTDINECLVSNGGCGSAALVQCANNPGAAATCTDINECLVNNGGCGLHAVCVNQQVAPPTCICDTGYVLVSGACVSNLPVVNAAALQGASGCIGITFSLFQAQAAAVDVTIEYMLNNSGVWKLATGSSGGDGATQLASGADLPGQLHTWFWNSTADLPVEATGATTAVVLRVTPTANGKVGAGALAAATLSSGFGLKKLANVATGPLPRGVLAGDLNRDGKPDLIAINSNGLGAGSLSVRLGDGTGLFGDAVVVPVGVGPRSGVLGDFDRDGKLDIAVLNFGNGSASSVSLLLGKGDGTFAVAAQIDTGAGLAYAAAGDVDLDGNLDLVVADTTAGNLHMLRGKGDGTFVVTTIAAAATGSLALADFNEDGKLDLLLTTPTNAVQTLLGVGNFTFGTGAGAIVPATGPLSNVAAVDWNRDGHFDAIASSTQGDSLVVLIGDGKGGLMAAAQLNPGTTMGYRALAVGDFDQDGNSDVVVGGTAGTTGLTVHLGDGVFGTSGVRTANTGGVWGLAVADFNLDGASDVAVAIDGVDQAAVVLGQVPQRCDWSLDLPIIYTDTAGPVGLATADLNRDGVLELITSNAVSGSVGVLQGKTDGTFVEPAKQTAADVQARAVVVADFNRDGLLDSASANAGASAADISVLFGLPAAGGFAAAVSIGACAGARDLVTGDLDRDGYLDLVVVCDGQYGVLLGKSNGTFAPAQLTVLAGGPNRAVTGDFNRDGKLDLAFTLAGTTAVSVQLGTGAGTFVALAPTSAGTAGALWSLSAGDFTSDGNVDLLVVSTSGVPYRLLTGKGDGTLNAAVAIAGEASAPHDVVPIDINRDGKLDFVAGYFATGGLGVYLGNGQGGFLLHKLYAGVTGGAFEGIVAGDFNRDGRWDIAVSMGAAMNHVAVFLQGNQQCLAKGPAPVLLGVAGTFVVLAKTGVSTVPGSLLTGNVGVSPVAATYLTGFDLIADPSNVFSTSTQVVGKLYAADYAVPTPANMTTAVSNMEAAYTDAAGRTLPDFTELGAGNIGGKTLTAGLYKWSSSLLIPTDVVLTGCPSDVWIFEIAGDLTMAAAKKVTLAGGAQAKNIFWQVAGKVIIGTTSHFEGVVLCKTDITLETGATMNGRLLAQTAVSLQQATVVQPTQ